MFGDGYKTVHTIVTAHSTLVIVGYDRFDVCLRNIDDAYSLTCNIFKLSGNMSVNFEQESMYKDGVEAFIEVINGKRAPIDGETFIAYVKLMDRIYESLETGKIVEV